MSPLDSTAPTDQANPPIWQNAVDQFLRYIQHEKRLSALTVGFYRDELRHLFTALPLAPQRISEMAIRRLITQDHARGHGVKSLARRLSAWRSFFRYHLSCGTVDINPAQKVRPPKGAKKLPSTLSVDQMAGLLDRPLPDHVDTIKELRDRAIYELMYSSGLRLSEIVSLNLAEGKRLDCGELSITGKRQKTRMVPVGAKAIHAVSAWIRAREAMMPAPNHLASASTPLFINNRGTRLSARTIERNLAKRAQQAQLPVHVHPHMLRHSFASHVLQSSTDLRAVQEMLGHESIASTQIYTHLDFQQLTQVYDRAHPRARNETPKPS